MIMSLFKAINISGSGLTAQGFRMDVISQNIANATTTRTAEGGPYRRKETILRQQDVSFEEWLQNEEKATGVMVAATVADPSPFVQIYDPAHPDADEAGFVSMPNVDVTREYVDLITASRAYEANITAINTAKQMARKALEIGR